MRIKNCAHVTGTLSEEM